MFGRFKPVTFDPYASRRRRSLFRLPRWLVLLLGLAGGAVGVIVVQERYLPPRLSAAETVQLRSAYEHADADRARLKSELDAATRQLQSTAADRDQLKDALAASKGNVETLRADIGALVGALPPDPRGGSIEVRAGQFAVKAGALSYEIVLTRDKGGAKPIPAVMQLIVSGDTAKGSDGTASLKPVSLTIGAHEVVRGSQPLPDGFRAKQATIQLLDRVGGRPMGMRVMLIK